MTDEALPSPDFKAGQMIHQLYESASFNSHLAFVLVFGFTHTDRGMCQVYYFLHLKTSMRESHRFCDLRGTKLIKPSQHFLSLTVFVCIFFTIGWHYISVFPLYDRGWPAVNPASIILSSSLATDFKWSLSPRSSHTVANENKVEKAHFFVHFYLLILIKTPLIFTSGEKFSQTLSGNFHVYKLSTFSSPQWQLMGLIDKGFCVSSVSWEECNLSLDWPVHGTARPVLSNGTC